MEKKKTNFHRLEPNNFIYSAKCVEWKMTFFFSKIFFTKNQIYKNFEIARY